MLIRVIVFVLLLNQVVYAQVCGNSSIESGEECDDGGVTSGDGCSSTCTTESGFYCGCASPTASFGSTSVGGFIGGSGGGPSGPISCASNEALIGLALNMSNAQQNATRTKIICGTLSIDSNGDVSTTQSSDQTSGGSGCFSWDPSTWTPDTTCPSGYVITGLTGRAVGGTLFSDVTLICSKIFADGTVSDTDTQNIFISGSSGAGSVDQTANCPSGTIAQAFETRSGCGQDALQISCAPVSFNCLGQSSICTEALVCGDGVVQGSEICDDGNTTSSDGCSSSCTLESGYGCAAGPVNGPCSSGGSGTVSNSLPSLGCTGTDQTERQVRMDGNARTLRSIAVRNSDRIRRSSSLRASCGFSRSKLREDRENAEEAYLSIWQKTWIETPSTTYSCDRGVPSFCSSGNFESLKDSLTSEVSSLYRIAKRLVPCGRSSQRISRARNLKNSINEDIEELPSSATVCQ